MRILAYSSYYRPYTSGLTVYLERVLKNIEYDATVITFKHDASLPRTELVGNVTIKRMPFLFRVSKGFISPQSWLTFFLEARRHDVIVLNIPNAEAAPLALIGHLMNKRIIALYHCDIAFGHGGGSQIIKAFLQLSISLQLMLADHVVAYPDYVESLKFYKQYRHKITTSLPPIEVAPADESFLSTLKKTKAKKRWVGFVGRFSREKGIEYLIGALKHLKRADIELILVGPKKSQVVGEQKYHDLIMTILKESDIPYRVFSSPSDAELSAIYHALDVLVLPSVNSTEAFGMVQAEAMVCGTPVVATDLPGIRQPVTLTGNGKIVPPSDLVRMAHAIDSVVGSSKSRADVTKSAKKIFDASKIYSFYTKLLARNKQISIRK